MKNKKITLHSIGNQDNLNFYVFDKKQKVAEILDEILGEILDMEILHGCLSKDKKINIEKYSDIHQSDFSKNGRIDVFFGNKKMFVTIHCSEKLRLKFNEALFKYTKMPKPIKIKKKKFKKK